MSLLSYLRLNKKSAQTAKDRLHIIIAQQRSEKNSPDYLPLLRKEILDVIAKYTKADLEKISVELQTKNNDSVLELNVVLPQSSKTAEV